MSSRIREEINFLHLDKYDGGAVGLKYLLSQPGLFNSADKETGKQKNRYLRFYKKREEAKDIILKLYEFIASIDSLARNNSDMDDVLGYVYSDACVNLRIRCDLPKDEAYRAFEGIATGIFTDKIFSFTKSADAFRILKKRAFPYYDKITKQVKRDSVLLVLGIMEAKMDAFVKEQEVAEDLYLLKSGQFGRLHFKNSSAELPRYIDNYLESRVYLLNESNRRIDPTTPLKDGKFVFLKDKDGKLGCRIADVAVYSKMKHPTYISIKSFGNNQYDKVHMISIKIDNDKVCPPLDYAIGNYLYHMVGDRYQEAGEVFKRSGGNIQETLEFVKTVYKKDNRNSEYLEQFRESVHSSSRKERMESILHFLANPFFRYWGINPFLYIHTFKTYDKENGKKIRRFSTKDVFEVKDGEILDSSLGCVDFSIMEDFIKEAFGKGYVLAAIRDRFVYTKDYRKNGLRPKDYKIKQYRVCYPVSSRNAVEIRLMTKTLTIIGEIYPSKSLYPNTVSFFYYYNDFEDFFGKKEESNALLDEGFLLNGGFNHRRPYFDRLM